MKTKGKPKQIKAKHKHEPAGKFKRMLAAQRRRFVKAEAGVQKALADLHDPKNESFFMQACRLSLAWCACRDFMEAARFLQDSMVMLHTDEMFQSRESHP